jgi:PAS domain S-box-containing protein
LTIAGVTYSNAPLASKPTGDATQVRQKFKLRARLPPTPVTIGFQKDVLYDCDAQRRLRIDLYRGGLGLVVLDHDQIGSTLLPTKHGVPGEGESSNDQGVTMTTPEGQSPEQTEQQVNDLFDSGELTKAVETEEFRVFLDHIPIAIVISKLVRGDQRIVYANKAYEALTGQPCTEVQGKGWSTLSSFRLEDEPHLTLGDALPKSDDFLGTFKREQPKLMVVEAYSGIIENEDAGKVYRIVALIDVTERERTQREEFTRRLRDKDILLKELQHRVKNNLQLITALIRLDARNQPNEDRAKLDRLAGRIEALQLLYRDLTTEGLGQAVDLGHYVSEIASAVMHTYAVDGIRLDLKVDHAPVSINVAMPVGLLVNELLTNAFKHAFSERESGTITVRCLHEHEDHYQVVVADDGIGLPEDAQWPVQGKLGALVLQSLRENVETDFNVESARGKGMRVTINFVHRAPLAKPN